jgi:hypothetical protein
MTNTAAAALPLPSGFSADDACPTCRATGEQVAPVTGPDGEIVLDADEVEVTEAVTCDDCDGIGYSLPVVEVPAASRFATRVREHAEYVAEFGPGASCGGRYCRCPR